MLGAWLIGAAALQAPASVSFENSVFQIREGQQRLEISLADANLERMFPADRITLSYGGKEVIFDRQGMHIKQNGVTGTSRLPALATSNKVFSADEIKANQAAIKAGDREAGFSALSGYQTIGSTLYLLLRWEDKKKEPWFEGIVRMDMSAANPSAEYVGKLDGLSFARGIVDDRLNEEAGQLVALVRNKETWGASRFDPAAGTSMLSRYGSPVSTARFMDGGTAVAGLAKTTYNSTIVTWVDLVAQTHMPVAEVKGSIKDLVEPHYLRYVKGQTHWLLNLRTGANLKVEAAAAEKDTNLGLLLWWPAENPKHAVLCDPDTFRPKAGWHAPAAAEAGHAHPAN